MPVNVDDVFRQLSTLLLKGPRDPRTKESASYRLSEEVLAKFGYSALKSPVAGVGLRGKPNGEKSVVIFLQEKIDDFANFLVRRLHLEKFRISQLVTGIITPSRRPTIGGESIGEGDPSGQSGTFGCLVDDAVGDKFLLSCNHVLSDVNSGKRHITPAWQPSARDGGTRNDRIGILYDFAPIVFGGFIPNEIDAALAKPDNPADVSSGLKGIGAVRGTASQLPYTSLAN